MSSTGEDSRETRLLGGLRIFLEGLGSSQTPFVMRFLSFLKTCVLLPPKLSLAVNRNIMGITRAGQGPGSSLSSSLSEVSLLHGVSQTVLDLRTLVKC